MFRNCMILSLALLMLSGLMFTIQAQGPVENLLDNGSFEDGVLQPWNTYGAVATEVVDKIKGADVDEPVIDGTFALYIQVLEKGANFWDSGLQHAGHVFDKGKVYTLSAWLKAAKGTMQINFKPELGQDPWPGYGEKAFTFTDTWAEYYTTTPPMPVEVQPATITFHIAYDVGEFWIDGVRWYEGEYVPSEGAQPKAVQPEGKLASVWASIKQQ